MTPNHGRREGGALASVFLRRRRRRIAAAPAASTAPDKGLSLLEWTSKLAPQGAIVTGARARGMR